MSSSDNPHRKFTAFSALAVALIATGLLLVFGAVAWAQDGIDVGPDGDITIRDGDKLIQVDEACVLLRNGQRDLSVGDRCPENKPQDTNKTADPSEKPESGQPSSDDPQAKEQEPGGTTGALTNPEATTETTTKSTTEPVAKETTTQEQATDLQPVTVERAVDGDTLQISPRVEDTDTVRLIGLDTPEMATDEAPTPEPLAEEAAEFTAKSLEGEEILLELDEDTKDDYDRLLAYAWVEDPTENDQPATAKQPGSLFNETLLRQGHAKLFTVKPNVMYLNRLQDAEAAAKEDELGLWGLETAEKTGQGSTDPESNSGRQYEPELVPTGNQDPIDDPENTTSEDTFPETSSEPTQQSTSPDTGGTTARPTDQGLQGGTTVTNDAPPETTGGTTMETTATTSEEPTGTNNPEDSTSPDSFDREGLKKEATRIAQETLDPPDTPELPAEPESEPEDVTPSSLDAGTPTDPSASEELPVSQPTEPPVQILPDSGGPALVIILALLFIGGGTAMLVHNYRATARPDRTTSDPGDDRRGG